MKTTTIDVNVYEPGDIIELHSENFNLVAKRRTLNGAKRAMVIGAKQRMDKLFTYKIVTDTGTTLTFTPTEQGTEQYIGHVDLGLLFQTDETA